MKRSIIIHSIISLVLFISFSASAQDVKYITDDSYKNFPFSEAVQVGNMLYLSGQVGNTEDGKLVPGGITAETHQVMENIKASLEKNGSSMDQVVKCTCMLADIKDWAAMSAEYIKYFPKHKPARSAFAGSGLALGARVEIECIAVVK